MKILFCQSKNTEQHRGTENFARKILSGSESINKTGIDLRKKEKSGEKKEGLNVEEKVDSVCAHPPKLILWTKNYVPGPDGLVGRQV